MATKKQIEANRGNAQKSTGPRTAEGKSASRLNAVKHGLLSETLVVHGLERLEDWEAFRESILDSLKPIGGLEELLAQKVIAAAWRLSRVERFERDTIDAKVAFGRSWSGADQTADETSGVSGNDPVGGTRTRGGQLPDLDTLTTLTRYESHLHRQFMQCLHELQRVQARRLGAETAVPTALDVLITRDAGEPEES